MKPVGGTASCSALGGWHQEPRLITPVRGVGGCTLPVRNQGQRMERLYRESRVLRGARAGRQMCCFLRCPLLGSRVGGRWSLPGGWRLQPSSSKSSTYAAPGGRRAALFGQC